MTFPLNPSVGQETSVAGKRYRWNGELWTRVSGIVSANLVNSAAIIDNTVALVDLTSAVTSLILSKANISDLTSSNVTEGSNLYFSNARVYDNVIGIGYSTNAYVNSRLLTKANVSDLNTSNITEGNNLYFNNTRAVSALTAGIGISLLANGLITSTALGGVTSVNGSNGNVQLYYTSDTPPSTSTLGSLWFNSTQANLYVLINDGTSNVWLEITPSENYGVTAVFGQTSTVSNAQLACATISSGILNTNNVVEGSNLYFTNTRAVSALTGGAGITIAANGRITGASQYGDSDVYSNVNLLALAPNTYVNGTFSTNTYVNNRLLTKANLTDLTTSVVTEGTNLYFTNTRSIYSLTSGSGISIASNGRITSTVSGGAVGGGADMVFYLNDNVITANYTVPTGKNAITGGPITINDNVIVTVSDGSAWTIV